ncbi:MAG: peptidylprolyl isomerase [Methylobacterium sp.]|nr:peptidylprolyl isomerase [Methylobacterium sp.]MCA3606284.1 peptidylprolyl isomerase [Methylobacterium sp.]MCA3609717.1 peptidylprolyl isomerase [Methylobacterium sp.]MCA3618845.1 peptidylprolyl isomerase [Methylobacterium sp.]MCA3622168.1 peptidylprolyl isomerase [Methylobacterium sp.]
MSVRHIASALVLAVLTVGPVFAQSSKVLATVNGEAITEAEAKVALEDLLNQLPNVPEDKRLELAVDFLVEVKLAAQAARKAKIDQSPDFTLKMNYARDRILMERLFAEEGSKATGEAAVKKFYDEQVAKFAPVEEVRARHILVESEEEAKKIHARLKGGEDFAKVATETSKDPGSGKGGGDLGYFSKDRMVPEFAEAAFALKAGEISAPVKSQFGWHIIKLEDRRNRPAPAFADVRERLSQALAERAQAEFIEKLRKEARIDRPGTEKK